MEKETKLVLVKTSQLYPHPDNPRKEIGDISEMVESVKKNGIMQNLTIMPLSCLDEKVEKQPAAEDISLLSDFIVLIGHRRLSAAKEAHLEEVPCRIISKISKNEQVGIMLEENMQRNDLTIYEQAQGFQMMLDLGENANSIAEKTGFSKSTVYHRLNLAKLDQEELKKKQDREGYQISLKDLYELEKLTDIEKRNEVLRSAKNSNDIAWRVKQMLEKEKEEKKKAEVIRMLEEVGVKEATQKQKDERYGNAWRCIKTFYSYDKVPTEITFEGEKERFYTTDYYIAVYEEVDVEVQKKKTKEQLERDKRDKNRNELKDIENRMKKRKTAFIESIISGELKVNIDENTKDEIWKCLICEDGCVGDSELIGFLSDKPIYKLTEEEENEYIETLQKLEAWKTMLMALCVSMDNIGTVVDYQGEYLADDAKRYEKGYKILIKYGWYFTEEEQQLLDGTHELYEKKMK